MRADEKILCECKEGKSPWHRKSLLRSSTHDAAAAAGRLLWQHWPILRARCPKHDATRKKLMTKKVSRAMLSLARMWDSRLRQRRQKCRSSVSTSMMWAELAATPKQQKKNVQRAVQRLYNDHDTENRAGNRNTWLQFAVIFLSRDTRTHTFLAWCICLPAACLLLHAFSVV